MTSCAQQHLVELLNIALSIYVIPHNAHFSKSAPIWINPAIQLQGSEISTGIAWRAEGGHRSGVWDWMREMKGWGEDRDWILLLWLRAQILLVQLNKVQ